MKTTKLPLKLTIALGQYFLNYQLSQPQKTGETHTTDRAGKYTKTEEFKPGREWNKQEDLDRISKSLPSTWGYEACAGTFWLHRKGKKNILLCFNQLWPLAKVIKEGELH